MVAFGDKHVTRQLLAPLASFPHPRGRARSEGKAFFPRPFSQTRSPALAKRIESAERSPVDGGDLADCTGLAFVLVSSC